MGPEGDPNSEIQVFTQLWSVANITRPPADIWASRGQNNVIEVCVRYSRCSCLLWDHKTSGGAGAFEEHNNRKSTKRTNQNAGQNRSQCGQYAHSDHVWAWTAHSPNHIKWPNFLFLSQPLIATVTSLQFHIWLCSTPPTFWIQVTKISKGRIAPTVPHGVCCLLCYNGPNPTLITSLFSDGYILEGINIVGKADVTLILDYLH